MQGIFQNLGRNILATRGDNQFLLTARNTQVARFVDSTQITGLEPAINEGGLSFLRQVVIALHDADTLYQDLTVFIDTNRVTRPGEAHRIRREVRGPFDGNRPSRLRQTIALQKGNTKATVEVGKVSCQGSATANDRVEVRAKH